MSTHPFIINDDIQDFFYQSQSSNHQSIHNDLKYQQISTHLSSKSKKLLRNKLSAQNSRIKKKKYIEDLQSKEKQLIHQLQTTQKQIDKTKQELNIILSKNQQNDSFNHNEKHTYQKLAILIDHNPQEFMDQDQANMLIQLLINRVGVTGKQRRRMVEYYSKRLINFSIPAIYRYLLNASTAQNGLFTENHQPIYGWDQELYHKVKLSETQTQLFLEGKSRFTGQKLDWSEKINSFEEVIEEIYNTSYRVEEVLLSIKQILTVKQIGEFIVGLQNRKYNKEIALCENEIERPVSKKVKLN